MKQVFYNLLSLKKKMLTICFFKLGLSGIVKSFTLLNCHYNELMNGLKACLNKLKFLSLDKHANRIFPLCREWRHCWAVVVLRPQVNLGAIINESKHNLERHYSCLLARELDCKSWTWFLSAHLFQDSHGGCHPAQVCLWARQAWAWRVLAVPEHVP